MEFHKEAYMLIYVIFNKQQLDIKSVLKLIQILNTSPLACKDIINFLGDAFKNQKSSKILVGVYALQYMVKNCNVLFHIAANRQSFQKRLLSLLNRLRGKTSILKQINSNTDNWCKIEAKVLYIIQLWYDTFILEESKYPFIINTYKILRKENVTFPPRSKNQKHLMAVSTQSPIFDNLQQIADQDQKKFYKKLNALGLGHLQTKIQKSIEIVDNKKKIEKKQEPTKRQVNIDEISEKIAIIQSTENSTRETMRVIEEIKESIQFGVVKKNQEKYWSEVKSAAEKLVQDWEIKNAQFVKQEERSYLEKKLGMIGDKTNESRYKKQQPINFQKEQIHKMDLLDDLEHIQQHVQQEKPSKQYPSTGPAQMNLLDL